MLQLENTSQVPLSLIDVREGNAGCIRVWQIEITLDSGRVLQPVGWYSPAGFPRPVTVAAGATYVREFQLTSYVEHYVPTSEETATVRVHHDVSEQWRRFNHSHQAVVFWSEPLEIRMSDHF